MNAPAKGRPRAADIDRYRDVRAASERLAAGLSAEDLAAQAMADASPGKWHLAHTSWFFEALILARTPGYRPVDERLRVLFNSYYEALGERVARGDRGLSTRPSLDEVMAYRREIDRRMAARLDQGLVESLERYLFELGLNHEQQHQELFLMDILALMARSPLDPAAYECEPTSAPPEPDKGGRATFGSGLSWIGADDDGFAFDNEGPRHRVFLEPFGLDHDLVANHDWIRFIDDGGYARPELWLSDGWATVKANGWIAPAYWRREADGGWSIMTLSGRMMVDPARPVRHVSFYEADAFARWSGARLPTEAEWEAAATARPASFSNLFGQVWQWTADAYRPYPGFRPTEGTAAEYNGKFMANQMVLRGSSFATPAGHERTTYRNFFYPHQRWAFAGVRLAADLAAADAAGADDAETAAFRRDLIDGLSRSRRAVPPKWFYDAEGSRLFEAITRLPEYYPTRQEMALLAQAAPDLAARFGPGAVLVEFGSGASEKTRLVLDAAADLAAYVPIDISPTALAEAAGRIRAGYPGLSVRPMVGDFETLGDLPADLGAGRRIGFFPGSTIGNLAPDQAVAFLNRARGILGEGALFVLGVDLVKDPAVLVRAYDDAAGVTAAFNRNLLVRANRQLGADFDVRAFAHEASWDEGRHRIEMHLKASRPMRVGIGGKTFDFAAGETIHTESSRKFTPDTLAAMIEAAGWRLADLRVSAAPSVALAVLES